MAWWWALLLSQTMCSQHSLILLVLLSLLFFNWKRQNTKTGRCIRSELWLNRKLGCLCKQFKFKSCLQHSLILLFLLLSVLSFNWKKQKTKIGHCSISVPWLNTKLRCSCWQFEFKSDSQHSLIFCSAYNSPLNENDKRLKIGHSSMLELWPNRKRRC